SRRRPRSRPRWSTRRWRATARPTSASPASRSTRTSRGWERCGEVPGPPAGVAEGGASRPAGEGRGECAARARLGQRLGRRRGEVPSLRGGGRRGGGRPEAGGADGEPLPDQPGDRGSRHPRGGAGRARHHRAGGRPMKPRVAVVTFPGSNDDRDALRAVRLMGGEPVSVWHADQGLAGADAVILPGGFSYGDYLRTGAIARFAPVMDAVRELAAAGGPVLGICNGFQILCEAGLLPGALIRNRGLAFVCRWINVR